MCLERNNNNLGIGLRLAAGSTGALYGSLADNRGSRSGTDGNRFFLRSGFSLDVPLATVDFKVLPEP